MFITVGSITKYVSDFSAHMLLATGNARIATAKEAAECISRLVINGDERMIAAEEDFKRIYAEKSEGKL